MSKCISYHGEYSDHEYPDSTYVCDLCGVFVEEALIAEVKRISAELEEIRWKFEQQSNV